MSKTAQRFAAADAIITAKLALAALRPHVDRAVVAGSIRRGRPDVGDIDLVVQTTPSPDNPWARHGILNAFLGEMRGYAFVREGAFIAHLEDARHERPSIDLYFCTEETWGITLLVRTGSAAHNIRMANVARKRLPRRSLSVARGILDTADNVIASRTEEEIFAALGLGYIEPEKREAPELEFMVRQESA